MWTHLEARLKFHFLETASGKMPMLSRFANPLVVWTIFSVAAFAQQPGNRPTQPGVQQPARQPSQQQPVGQQPPRTQQQPGVQQPNNPPGATQPLTQEPINRSASTTNGLGNAPIDRQALEQQLAAQQAALAAQLLKPPSRIESSSTAILGSGSQCLGTEHKED